jgi:hypothetical protein
MMTSAEAPYSSSAITDSLLVLGLVNRLLSGIFGRERMAILAS